MILDLLTAGEPYVAVHPGLRAALEFLRRPSLAALPDGRCAIDGERLYAMVMRGRGAARSRPRMETHRRYIDVQYTVAGAEELGWSPAAGLRVETPYDPAKDAEFYHDAPAQWLACPPGMLAMFFPHDAHCGMNGTGQLHKVVVKIAVD